MLGFLIAFVGFLFLPIGFKFIGFIIPLLIFAYVFRNPKNERLNINVLVLMLCIYILIPTSLFTFDSSKSFDFDATMIGVYAMVGIFACIILIGMPIFCAISCVWAFIIGRGDVAGKQLLRLVIFVGLSMIVISILAVSNIDFPYIDTVGNLYVSLINVCFQAPFILYNAINTIIGAYNSICGWIGKLSKDINKFFGMDDKDAKKNALNMPSMGRLPSIPSYSMPPINMTFDSTVAEFSAMGYPGTMLAVHNSLPIIMGILCLITALFTMRKDWEAKLIETLQFEIGKKQKKERVYLAYINVKMLIFMFVIILCAFYAFLSYSRAFGIDPKEDWRIMGFLFLYVIMIMFSVIVLNLQGFTKYTDASLKKTLQGCVYGLLVLYCMTRTFTQQQVFDAFSAGGVGTEFVYIVNYFIFIAPAESMFFHVLWPSLVHGQIEHYYDKKDNKVVTATLREQLVYIELEKNYSKRYAEIAKRVGTKTDFAVAQAVISELEQEYESLVEEAGIATSGIEYSGDARVFGRRNSIIVYFIFAVFLGNFAFSCAHWILPYVTYNLSFIDFWMCGLGMIYFAGGCWFTYVAKKWGWFSCVFVHATFNTLTAWAVIIMTT